MPSAFYLLLTVLPLTGTPKYSVKSRKRKRGKDCGPGAQSVGHASSEPSTTASLQWPALVTSEMLCFWNKLKLENNKFVQQEDSYMYKASCEAFLVSEDTLIDYESLEVGRYVHSVGRANNNSLSLDINVQS